MTATPIASKHPRPWLGWLARLPFPVFRFAGWLMAAVLYAFAGRRRRIVNTNLALCFPEQSAATRRLWAWQTFKHFSQSFLDRVWLWHGDPQRIRERVSVVDPHGLLQSHASVLHFAPHFYGMDAGWTRLTLDYPRHWWTFYAPQGSPAMDRWVKDGRRRFGGPRLVSRREGIRPLLRGLKEGAALCLLPDMDLGARDSVFVPFFGHEAATVTSLHRLANATGVQVVPLVVRMVPEGYELHVEPAWTHYPTGDDVADARYMNEKLEGYIRSMPSQYHWLHRRFKTRPPGAPRLYR